MLQARVFISGFVQGVGFRVYVRNKAWRLGITGWVRNLTDGRVEAVLQGDKSSIDQLINTCNKGPFLAEVHEINVQWEEVKEQFEGFALSKTI